MSTSIMAANAMPSAVTRPLVAPADTSLTVDDSRDSDLDFDESFRTTGTQHSAYTLNDGDTTFDEDGYDDAQDKAAGRQSMDIDGEDDNEGLTESQIESKDKKRRRRTNKDEATVLSAVFEETAFPDVHTRTALAERLQMDLRSVSIWFQNKRQAMKKRASRYGGIDGVGSQSHDDYEPRLSTDSLDAPKKASLRRWASLDDVASRDVQSQYGLLSRTSHDAEEHDRRVQTRETQRRVSAMMEPKPAPAKGKSCTAPLLDALRRCRGKSLARFVSLPGKTVQLVAPASATADGQERSDLRELLFGAEGVVPTRTASMQRSASMMHLSALSNSEDEASLPGTQVGETSMITSLDVISPDQIWKRMASSSSGGTFTDLSTNANTDDSDKENASRDAICEDEEHTLRKIANKRAAREQAKLEQKLSSQGARYLQEADARVALQQKTSKDASRPEALGLRRTPSLRDVGNGTDQLGRRSALSRVVSLDLSAGHDRSKAPGKALMQIMDEFERERQRRLARRVAAAKQAKEDAEAEAARRNSALRRVHSTPSGEHDSQGAWSTNHMPNPHGGYAHSSTAMSMPRLPQLVRSASGSLSLRPPARPLTRVLSSGHLMPGLMARHLDSMPRLSGYASQHYAPNTADLLHPSRPRQSLSAQTSTKSVRSSSDDGASEGWTERWAREQRSISVRSSSERDRGHDETGTRGASAFANKAAKRTHEAAARPANDTMPFFDDDAENGENVAPSANAGTQSKRRRVEMKSSAPLQQRDRKPLGGSAIAASATSGNAMRSPLRALGNATRANASPMSSPLKSGNERDRLAAETLLGLGFQM